jgi:hypothetical protein
MFNQGGIAGLASIISVSLVRGTCVDGTRILLDLDTTPL